MSGFLRLFGSLLLFLFIATIFFGEDFKDFFPNDYKSIGDDLIDNKWSLFVLSIIISTAGSVTNVAKAIYKNRKSQKVSDLSEEEEIYQAYGISNDSPTERIKTRISDLAHQKNNFIDEQYRHKGIEFASKQHGKLKDLAMKVDWTPLSRGGANFKTSELKQVNSTRLEVHKSKGGLLFSGLFAVVGLFSMVFGSYVIIQDHGLSFTILAPILFGGVFAAVGKIL